MAYSLILFDRDGTLTYEDRNYHHDLAKVKAYPFAGPLLARLTAKGYRLGVVTNQSGIGRGLWTREEVDTFHERLEEKWGLALGWHVCPHHPDEGCPCRKPEPTLINTAMASANAEPGEVLFVGDSVTDAGAAQAAGVDFALVLTGRGRETLKMLPYTVLVLDSVAQLEAYLG